jgi:hypothetical protein
MPLLTTAAMLLASGLPGQSSPNTINIACSTDFPATRAPLSTELPSGVSQFERCIEIEGWGDSARFVPSPTGGSAGGGRTELDAFSLALRGEGPEVMRLRSRQLAGQPILGGLALWQVRLSPMPKGTFGGVELTDVQVQSVTTGVDIDGTTTRVLLQPREATWRAWRPSAPGPVADSAVTYSIDFSMIRP